MGSISKVTVMQYWCEVCGVSGLPQDGQRKHHPAVTTVKPAYCLNSPL
jgi:hypothetical protein